MHRQSLRREVETNATECQSDRPTCLTRPNVPTRDNRKPASGDAAAAQPTFFHSSHRFVLKYSPRLSVTRPGPLRLLLAMMEPNSPLASLARSQ